MNKDKTKIGFFIRHFTECGTEVSIYDYADHNETILGNESVILSFTKEAHALYGKPYNESVFEKFNKRFKVIQANNFDEIRNIVDREKINVYYTQVWGIPEEHPYGDINNTKYFVHCVFDAVAPRGDIYVPISDQINKKNNTNFTVLPYMVRVGTNAENLRTQLNIPKDAIVFGRHGGTTSFDIPIAREAVAEVARNNKHIYFIFLNTPAFCEPLPNVIHLPCEVDIEKKRTFINTCDAMIHGRTHGETFGLAIGEFAMCLKPVICCNQFLDWAHLDILGDKAVIYNSKDELVNILTNFEPKKYDMTDNGYTKYTPEYVMSIFKALINKVV